MSDEAHARGMEVRRQVLGDAHVDRAIERTTPFTEDFQDLITRYAWGEIWSRPGLDLRTRSCITLTALVALGREHELEMHVRAALRNGLTPDEIADPHRLRLRTWVNDDLRQDSSTDDMIFSCWAMVEELSTVFTLEPGDVVSTGTPAGVGAGFDPPKWLVAGDTVRIEIEGIGVLENPVIDEGNSGRS